jgi:hypothetical protein
MPYRFQHLVEGCLQIADSLATGAITVPVTSRTSPADLSRALWTDGQKNCALGSMANATEVATHSCGLIGGNRGKK